MMTGVWVDMGCTEHTSIPFSVNTAYEGLFWIRAAPSMEFGEKSLCSPHFQPRSHSMTTSAALMQRDGTGPEDGIGNNVARKQRFLALQGNLEGLLAGH